MADREEIIRGLQIERECVSRDCNRDCGKCDLAQDRDWLLSVYNCAIDMLKEQEPVRFNVIRQRLSYPFWDAECDGCGYRTSTIHRNWKYCPECGRKVKWNEYIDGD